MRNNRQKNKKLTWEQPVLKVLTKEQYDFEVAWLPLIHMGKPIIFTNQ